MVEFEDAKKLFESEMATDGKFAIAFAIMCLAQSNDEVSRSLDKLGNGNAGTSFGAIENLAMMVEKVATSIQGIDLSGMPDAD